MDSKPLNDKSLNAKSLLLSILSLLSILFIVITLQASWNNPQEQTKLDLLQTDLILQALQTQENSQDSAKDGIFQVLIGDGKPQDIYSQALSSYQEVIQANKSALTRLDRLSLNIDTDDESQSFSKQRQKKQTSISELSVRAGLLQVQTGDIQGAIATWESVTTLEGQSMTTYGLTAQILTGLWAEPTMLFPNAETQIRRTLDGWYRKTALTKLYQSQQRTEKLPELEEQVKTEVTLAIDRLIVVNSIPLIGGGVGSLLWIGLIVQWIFFRTSSPFYTKSLNLETDQDRSARPTNWQVPWGIATTWEVMVLWFTAFCLMTQLFLPLIFEILGIQSRVGEDFTLQALLVLIPYILSVMPMLPILQASLAKYRPLPEGWFHFKINSLQWLGWGIGGYFAAVPIVLVVSVISQKFLQGQGGGNPLLPILIDSQNNLPKFLLWTTLAIAAPFFEEYLFRGFLLPSLTKSLPVWGAIALSGFLFALAHLNIADIIPLSVLGMVMGFVYWRSGNLLSSMLLHCLWNSGSFFALIALGGK